MYTCEDSQLQILSISKLFLTGVGLIGSIPHLNVSVDVGLLLCIVIFGGSDITTHETRFHRRKAYRLKYSHSHSVHSSLQLFN